jgi:hypothetical protein
MTIADHETNVVVAPVATVLVLDSLATLQVDHVGHRAGRIPPSLGQVGGLPAASQSAC